LRFRWKLRTVSRHSVDAAKVAALLFLAALVEAPLLRAEEALIASWMLDEGSGETARDGGGAANGKIVRAAWTEGRSGGALAFEDYSVVDYIQPDVGKATRLIVPHSDALNPRPPFRIKASIYPTRDPVYYGGIIEKGRGRGASYRVMLLRGLKLRATAGGTGLTITTSRPLSLNAWHDIELIVGTGGLVLMIDGKEAGRADGTPGATASPENIVVGERFSGKIDSVELLSR
jgi:hypothetical protein